jgi:myosin-1
VLDLYGFEVFERNSFEQLIINYCNEKLHQFITNLTLKEEQEEIIREGLEWSKIEYSVTYNVHDFIEKNRDSLPKESVTCHVSVRSPFNEIAIS